MRSISSLALCVALIVLAPLQAWGQANPVFAQPYQYSDSQGPGVLTFTTLSTNNTRLSYQPISVVLTQSNRTYNGSGVYHSFTDDNAGLPPFTLVSFTLVNASGRSFFFQGSIAPVNGFAGEGTYWDVLEPQQAFPWRAQTQPTGTGNVIVNSAPALVQGWQRNTFDEAIGGFYYATFNTQQAAVSSATWSGNLQVDGSYKVEVFLPRTRPGLVPRTQQATYTIYEAGIAGQQTRRISQDVPTSQWVELGTFFFRGQYRVVLTDLTGEPPQSRSVIANAVRLTPAQ
jgi:hypothetical protein